MTGAMPTQAWACKTPKHACASTSMAPNAIFYWNWYKEEGAANMTFLSVTALRDRRKNRQAVFEAAGCNWRRRREGYSGIASTGAFGWHICRPILVL